MSNFISREKLSKKAKREQDLKKRRVWAINPVTRKPDNPNAYKRKKVQPKDDFDHFKAELFYSDLRLSIHHCELSHKLLKVLCLQ